jgi:hypothetical protein
MQPAAAALTASARPRIPVERVLEFLVELVGNDMHAKRILSIANATVGVIASGVLGVTAIGKGLAAVRGVEAKHATKQVDRLLSNLGIDLDVLQARWVEFLLADVNEAWVNVDWTDADADDQTTLVASLQEDRGRSSPLMWVTVKKSELKEKKFAHVEALLPRLRAAVPTHTRRVFIVADREFGNRTMYGILDAQRFDYVLRFRQDVHVTSWDGETRPAAEWQRATGKLRSMMSASVTVDEHRVGKVVIVRDAKMKDTWCLAASDPDLDPKVIKAHYGRRFQTEETFRDLKDPRFGMGLRYCSIGAPARRDKMLLLGVLAQAMLTLLGIAGERCGLDRYLKTNTSKERQHSLLRQGGMWYDLIPNMKQDRLDVLMAAFHEVAHEHGMFRLLAGEGK